MKRLIALLIIGMACDAFSACSRTRGEQLLRRFKSDSSGDVVTNATGCVRTVEDAIGEIRYFYSAKNGELATARLQRMDGAMESYDYHEGSLVSAGCSTTNLTSIVLTLFIGDGKETNSVDRMEFDVVNGKTVAMRLLDAQGKDIKRPAPTSWSSIDKEYIPWPGSSTRVGPYEWTIVGEKDREGVLTRNGRKILESFFTLGGKYPWIVGSGQVPSEKANRKELIEKGIRPRNAYSDAYFYFVLDMRNDHVEYIPKSDKDEIEKITGQRYGLYDARGFWSYALSKHGPERLAKLEAALKSSAE